MKKDQTFFNKKGCFLYKATFGHNWLNIIFHTFCFALVQRAICFIAVVCFTTWPPALPFQRYHHCYHYDMQPGAFVEFYCSPFLVAIRPATKPAVSWLKRRYRF